MDTGRFLPALRARLSGETMTVRAAQLGISKQWLSNVLNGHHGVSTAFAAKCIERWPTLADDYLADLRTGLLKATRSSRNEAVA